MLESYMQNSLVKMTKESYFEMCEALGTTPIETEIPIELDDFPIEVQEVMEIYRLLRDDWDVMNGNYMGKHFNGISEIFDITGVEPADRKTYLLLLNIIDNIRAAEIKKLKPVDTAN